MKSGIGRRTFIIALGGGISACGPSATGSAAASRRPFSRKANTMSQHPIDPYTWPHKMLRRLLFDAAQTAGTVDSDDTVAVRSFSEQLLHTFDVVERHAEHEEAFLHPLLARRLPELERSLRAEHETSHVELTGLRQLLGAIVGGESQQQRRESALGFYRALVRFTAAYLEHLDDEERALPRFWAHFEHDELLEVMRRFNASRAPTEAMADLERMLPALAPAEREQLLTRMRASAPDEAFRAACHVARRVLDDAAWSKLRACVSVP